MYDPMIVITDINIPPVKGKYKYEEGKGIKSNVYKFATLWHVDPEKDGTDDSCGWSKAKLSKKEIELIEKETIHDVWAIVDNWEKWDDKYRSQIIYTLYKRIKYVLYNKSLTQKDRNLIQDLTLNIYDCLNIYSDYPKDECKRLIYNIARIIKTQYRKWYQHPRFHFWHWKIQIHIVQKLHRYFFTKCCKCGKPFKWNEQVAGSWGGKEIWHFDCVEQARGSGESKKGEKICL